MEWIASMVFQIERYNTDGYHRWFDSGDLQSMEMLDAIVAVARMTPTVRHWIPTQERKLVSDWQKLGNTLPDNLNVRVSAAKLDGDKPPRATPVPHVHRATIAANVALAGPTMCP